ncbi:hypothetical protein DICVIV_11989 [Dictyocaulus viviparus]|uniref:Uncharacterized protein n=1 Tax=Dictyocaulus viviparus TaxID=29172 RepID=A0A0D8XED7_DICVI|nr:hypothetical protein DICVIV_11989 [Dictyocaulus viviparus]
MKETFGEELLAFSIGEEASIIFTSKLRFHRYNMCRTKISRGSNQLWGTSHHRTALVKAVVSKFFNTKTNKVSLDVNILRLLQQLHYKNCDIQDESKRKHREMSTRCSITSLSSCSSKVETRLANNPSRASLYSHVSGQEGAMIPSSSSKDDDILSSSSDEIEKMAMQTLDNLAKVH